MTDDQNNSERRVSSAEILVQVGENREAITKLEERLGRVEKLLQPVSDFYGNVQSDLNTLSRFGHFIKSTLAWLAAILISAGIIIAWIKNGFKFPGG
jgi:hypothetical protein